MQGQILRQKVLFRRDYDGLGDVALRRYNGAGAGASELRDQMDDCNCGQVRVWAAGDSRVQLGVDWELDANAVYSGTDIVQLESQATMLELGGGLTGRINANISVFANVDYEFAVGAAENEKRNGVRGAFGARYTW